MQDKILDFCKSAEVLAVNLAIALGTVLYVVRQTHTEILTVFYEFKKTREGFREELEVKKEVKD